MVGVFLCISIDMGNSVTQKFPQIQNYSLAFACKSYKKLFLCAEGTFVILRKLVRCPKSVLEGTSFKVSTKSERAKNLLVAKKQIIKWRFIFPHSAGFKGRNSKSNFFTY